MPIIFVNLIEGRTLDQKRELVKNLTDTTVDTLKVPRDTVRVILRDISKENFANGGVLKCDQ